MSRVVLVHGAWHGGWCWDPVVSRLTAAGHDVEALDLPSAGGTGGLADDAAVVGRAVQRSTDPTVVVGHSYGGIAITEGAARCSQVTHLVYVCAFMLDRGESLLGALGGEAAPWIEVDQAAGVSRVPDPIPVFYGDLDPAVAQGHATRLTTQSLASFAEPLTAVAWSDVSSTYIACTQDRAIPYPAQQAMSSRAGTVHTLESSHSPFLSHPDEVAAVIDGVAS